MELVARAIGLVDPLLYVGDLWVFGNAICAKVGNIAYTIVYVALGLCSGVIHLLLDGDPAVGASGAINGVVAMFLVFYPLNTISWGL